MLRTSILGRCDLRAVLVLAALISLCVSNNVGLSFLPLHGSGGYVSEIGQDNPNATASASRLPGEPDSFRVPIMWQKREGKGPQSHTEATTLRSALLFPGDIRFPIEETSSQFPCFSQYGSQPPGRAPPRLA